LKKYSPFSGEIYVNKGYTPILVYCIGKVGSKTIVNSLYRTKNNPHSVYQVHNISKNYLENSKSLLKDKGSKYVNEAITFNENISRFFFDNQNKMNWKIITVTRDPVAYSLSSFFEYLDLRILKNTLPELFDGEKPVASFNKFNEIFQRKFILNNVFYLEKWFKETFKEFFYINLFEYKFYHENLYQILKKKNIEILIFRLKDLDKIFRQAIKDFLQIDNAVISKKNIGEKKYYGRLYKFVKSHVKFDPELLDKIYKSEYCRHFYSEDEINKFKKYWSVNRDIDPEEYKRLNISPDNIFSNIDVVSQKEIKTSFLNKIKDMIEFKKNYV